MCYVCFLNYLVGNFLDLPQKHTLKMAHHHHHTRGLANMPSNLEDTKEPHISGNSSPSAITLERLETGITANDRALLYKEGRIILQPAPSADPKDPLNMPLWRKTLAIGFLCFFGAMAAAAELILGAMLPVFVLEYAGMDPKILKVLSENGGLPKGSDPLQYLSELPNAPPVWHVYLLGSLPVLMMGVANLFLVPLAISVGRRSVVLACGVMAIAGAIWAGFSQSLGSHLGARCLQALGAGTVESLLPFVVQDMVFIHQRNTAISGVFAAQVIDLIFVTTEESLLMNASGNHHHVSRYWCSIHHHRSELALGLLYHRPRCRLLPPRSILLRSRDTLAPHPGSDEFVPLPTILLPPTDPISQEARFPAKSKKPIPTSSASPSTTSATPRAPSATTSPSSTATSSGGPA